MIDFKTALQLTPDEKTYHQNREDQGYHPELSPMEDHLMEENMREALFSSDLIHLLEEFIAAPLVNDDMGTHCHYCHVYTSQMVHHLVHRDDCLINRAIRKIAYGRYPEE